MKKILNIFIISHFSITVAAFGIQDVSIFDGSEAEITKSPTNSVPGEITEDTKNSPAATEQSKAEPEAQGANEDGAQTQEASEAATAETEEVGTVEEEAEEEEQAAREEGGQEDEPEEEEKAGGGNGFEGELEDFIPSEEISADAGVSFPADI